MAPRSSLASAADVRCRSNCPDIRNCAQIAAVYRTGVACCWDATPRCAKWTQHGKVTRQRARARRAFGHLAGCAQGRQGQSLAARRPSCGVATAGRQRFTTRDVPASDMGVVNDKGSFVEDPQGRVLTSTNHGLARWDGTRWTLIDSRNGLPDIGITTLLFRPSGHALAGHLRPWHFALEWLWPGRGLGRGAGIRQRAELVDPALRSGARCGLATNLVAACWPPGQSQLQPWPVQFSPAPRQVLSLAKAADGAIWAGLYDHRVLRYDPVRRQTTLAAQLPAFVKACILIGRERYGSARSTAFIASMMPARRRSEYRPP